jgi:hypothetical protein
MIKKIDRRDFLYKTAKTGCSCIMAAGMAGCTGINSQSSRKKQSKLGAFCGLYCRACPLYRASISEKDNSKVVCLGCKSDKLAEHCQKCSIRPCALEKKLNSCGECSLFPCEKTKAFHSSNKDMVKVAEKNCFRVRETSYSGWMEEQVSRWTCKKCGTSFSFSDETCPNCRADVYSCMEEATDYLEKRV